MGLPQAARALVDRSLKPVGALNDVGKPMPPTGSYWFPGAYPNKGLFFFGGYLNSPDFG